ncbi:MAG: hypothetical protein E7252_09590 [Lachnospira sp.]|nr:hypothetical protein [Lachnospira sp.]
MTRKTGREIAYILVPILYGIIAILVAMLVCSSGQYPAGSETMTHIYRGDFMYNAIKDGNIFPLYDSMWYNGVEILKYAASLPMCIIAACQAIAGGDALDGYLVFVGLLFFVSAIIWFVIGIRKNRLLLGTVLGIIWFFMPNNMYVLFMEGDLARAICIAFLPLFVFLIYEYLSTENTKTLLGIMLVYIVLLLCDVDYSIMLAIAMVLFGIIYGIVNHKWKCTLFILLTMLLAFMISGIWTVSYMLATAAVSSEEVMDKYFQNFIKTINPFDREHYYYGLVALILAVFGMLCSKRKNVSGFVFSILILLFSAQSMGAVMRILPGSDYLLMCQYISIALAFVMYGFMNWDTLKKYICIIICVLLVIDIIPSMPLLYGTKSGISVEERFDEQYSTTMIEEAKALSNQRLVFIDGGELEAMGTYLSSSYKEQNALTYGSDFTIAATKNNITQLNKALNGGFYRYLFDRCKELGNDTVLIKLSQINIVDAPVEMLDAAAKASGYEMVGFNEFYRLYDMDIEGNWGTIAKYDAIGIGTGASDISLVFPNVKEVTTTNIEDFTFEELSQYKLIYLSGFSYNDRESAEELVIRLSEAGVKIVILADSIPEDRSSRKRDFLGLSCNDIVFSNGYPILDTRIGVLDCDLFPQGFEEWNTVYINGLDNVWGTVRENELDLGFYGTVKNDNIVVVGLNLTYYYSMIRDEGIGKLLSDITGMGENKLPQRTVVPITITQDRGSLKISTEYEDVNTGIAYHKMFENDNNMYAENNLLYVNKGTTVIDMNYSSFYIGMVVSALGIIGAIAFFMYKFKKNDVQE